MLYIYIFIVLLIQKQNLRDKKLIKFKLQFAAFCRFSPAIFCYLISALPSIWLLEIQLSEIRVQPSSNISRNDSTEDQIANSVRKNALLFFTTILVANN